MANFNAIELWFKLIKNYPTLFFKELYIIDANFRKLTKVQMFVRN